MLRRLLGNAYPVLVSFRCLLIIHFLLWRGGFPAVYKKVKEWRLSPRVPSDGEELARLFDSCSILFPRQNLCLTHSAAATCYLRSFGFPANLILGVRTLPFSAHAWIECSDVRCWITSASDDYCRIDCI
jgi:hypothetical protein